MERAQGLGDLKFCLLPTANNSRPKKYFHFKERQLPPGRDGVEWDSDDGYAEVGNYQVDQQQMIVSSQLKHREVVQCMMHPHIVENEGFLTLKYFHSSPSIARQRQRISMQTTFFVERYRRRMPRLKETPSMQTIPK